MTEAGVTPEAPGTDGHGQPILEVERDGTCFVLLGTAHVSRASVEAVERQIASGEYDAVAVELCEARFNTLSRPDALAELDVFEVVRQGKTALVAANLVLTGYQRRLAEQLGVEPGAEMKAAIERARERELPILRIDRDVGVTLRRAYGSVGFFKRVGIASGLFASLFVGEEIDEAEIEKLKQGDMLESAFSEFARRSQPLYEALIAERDRYMAAALREQGRGCRRVLVVIGAGHMKGLAEALRTQAEDPALVRRGLDTLPPPGRLGTWITVLLAAFVLGGFAYGFMQGADIGTAVVTEWVLATGTLGALGCLLAGGHPFSIIGAFVASPLTPLHPALASGTISALIEAAVRKPRVADFHALRDDAGTLGGWWRNRVARIFVNFFLTSFGTAIGVYFAGWQMISTLF